MDRVEVSGAMIMIRWAAVRDLGRIQVDSDPGEGVG